MDSASISNRDKNRDAARASSTRDPSYQDPARQVAISDSRRQERRAANNREIARRQANAALQESLERERAIERQNMQAGIEKMVRSVVRKESTEYEQSRKQVDSSQNESQEQVQQVRQKLDSTYNSSANTTSRDETAHPSPSQRQQQRAINDYQQSTRNSIDNTVELVV